jgi:hypothetical protein
VPLMAAEVEAGETVRAVTAGLVDVVVTVTTAEADLVGSATLLAITVAVPGLAGAVYTPEAVMLPRDAVQVTDLLDVPCTVAVKGRVPPTSELDEVGEIVTETPEVDVLVESGERPAALPAHPGIQAAAAARRTRSSVGCR